MKVIVTGASGLVGAAFTAASKAAGDVVVPLRRVTDSNAPAGFRWADDAAVVLDGAHVVVHLAGESIATGRWTSAKKQRIHASRVAGTKSLVGLMAGLKQPPATLIAASAIGFYGDRADEVLTEDSVRGTGYLADVCRDWEAAAAPAAERGVRVVWARFGMILDRQGGALSKMLTPFRLGAGGIIGSGRQYWSWVTLADVVRALRWLLVHPQVTGAVNVVAPQPVTNRDFTKALGAVLRRPTVFPLPAFVARLVLGEMADGLLLASARVHPARLTAAGFQFQRTEIRAALSALLREK